MYIYIYPIHVQGHSQRPILQFCKIPAANSRKWRTGADCQGPGVWDRKIGFGFNKKLVQQETRRTLED